MTRSAAAILLLALGQSTEIQDLDGWRAARWGMTEAEVFKAFPGEADHLAKPEVLRDGRTCSIGISAYKIQSMEFAVVFCFNEKHELSLVRIAPPEIPGNPISDSAAFSQLELLLVEKYGKPTSVKDELPTRRRMWRLSHTIIDLSHFSSRGFGTVKGISALFLTYGPPSKEADKL